jgi:hypothetical protein
MTFSSSIGVGRPIFQFEKLHVNYSLISFNSLDAILLIYISNKKPSVELNVLILAT